MATRRTRKNRKNQEGGAKIPAVGSKAQVWHGTAKHTSGGLRKKDLMKHKGRIISRKKHAAGKKAIKRLAKLGYKAKKGTFKLFKKGKRRGGGDGEAETPMDMDISGVMQAFKNL